MNCFAASLQKPAESGLFLMTNTPLVDCFAWVAYASVPMQSAVCTAGATPHDPSETDLADPETDVRAVVSIPRMYEVLLLNDDYTSMEFVVTVLMNVFRKSADEATAVMLAVHRQGKGVAGIYTLEIAETKVEQVRRLAMEAQFPLRCVIREAGA